LDALQVAIYFSKVSALWASAVMTASTAVPTFAWMIARRDVIALPLVATEHDLGRPNPESLSSSGEDILCLVLSLLTLCLDDKATGVMSNTGEHRLSVHFPKIKKTDAVRQKSLRIVRPLRNASNDVSVQTEVLCHFI
jgi:hypothetical protein